jgi:hypothetical protein
MLNALHITIPRVKLIEIITERRAALQQDYADLLDDARLGLSNLATVPAALNDWFADIATGLADGSYRAKADGTIVGIGDVIPPAKPTTSMKSTNKRHVQSVIERLPIDARNSASTFDTALLLLNLATDVDVTVAVGDYERMLNQQARGYQY